MFSLVRRVSLWDPINVPCSPSRTQQDVTPRGDATGVLEPTVDLHAVMFTALRTFKSTESDEAPTSRPPRPYPFAALGTFALQNRTGKMPSEKKYRGLWLEETEWTLLSTFWVIVNFDDYSVKN